MPESNGDIRFREHDETKYEVDKYEFGPALFAFDARLAGGFGGARAVSRLALAQILAQRRRPAGETRGGLPLPGLRPGCAAVLRRVIRHGGPACAAGGGVAWSARLRAAVAQW